MPEHPNDHDLLIELRVKLDQVIAQISTFVASQGDHERRLKALEQWRAWLLGAAAVGGAVASLIVQRLNL